MKTDLIDLNDTRKQLHVEIPSEVVDAEIERVARNYSRRARIPGFRPGKAPARVIKQRFKEQILQDVAQDLIPPAIDEALRERGVRVIDAPDVRDVNVEEGRALTFVASFETVPPFEPGEYETIALRRPSARIEGSAVDQALERLRERAARHEPVEGRGIGEGDSVTLDIERTSAGETDRHNDVRIELGAKANPPGFDEELIGLAPASAKSFVINYPADYTIRELAGTEVSYAVTVKTIGRRVLPVLDDEFAKDLGDFETLDDLRARVREDLEHEARHTAERAVRSDLMKQLATRLPFEAPESLVERELDRRIEELAQRLVEQRVDPRQANLDWRAFRESQRGVAREAVAAALVLDEVARREHLDPSAEEIDQEIAGYAERTGRTPAAVRAALEKEQGLGRIAGSLRRDKSVDFLVSRARILEEQDVPASSFPDS
jgi:trigger factor